MYMRQRNAHGGPSVNNYLQKISDRYQVSQILKTNETGKENGLTLSEEEAVALVEARRELML